jgi:hypothetical protein
LRGKSPELGRAISWLGGLGPVLVGTLIAAIVVVLVFVAIRIRKVRRRRRGRGEEMPPAVARVREARVRGRDEWRVELERKLGAGDVAGGLEALWWWFACSVTDTGVDASWTSDELLSRCRRTDLIPLARGLDRLLYGVERPGVAAVRGFYQEMRAVLP